MCNIHVATIQQVNERYLRFNSAIQKFTEIYEQCSFVLDGFLVLYGAVLIATSEIDFLLSYASSNALGNLDISILLCMDVLISALSYLMIFYCGVLKDIQIKGILSNLDRIIIKISESLDPFSFGVILVR